MATTKEISGELIKKIQQCMKEAGLEAEVKLSEHEATAYATKRIDGKTLRAVVHITDRETKPAASEALPAEHHLANKVIYPTLEPQTAAGAATGGTKPYGDKPTKKA